MIQIRFWSGWITPSVSDCVMASEEWQQGLGINEGCNYLQTVKVLMLAGF